MSTCRRRCFFNTKNKEVQHIRTRFIVDDRPSVADDGSLLGDLVDCGYFKRYPYTEYNL